MLFIHIMYIVYVCNIIYLGYNCSSVNIIKYIHM